MDLFCPTSLLPNNHTEIYKCSADSIGLSLTSSYNLNKPIFLLYALLHSSTFSPQHGLFILLLLHLLVTPHDTTHFLAVFSVVGYINSLLSAWCLDKDSSSQYTKRLFHNSLQYLRDKVTC